MLDDSRFLIAGGGGQLGLALKAKYPNAKVTTQKELDISDKNAIMTFDWSSVSTIFNAAAYTDIDGAETPGGRITAWKVNALGPAYLSKIARERDIMLVHLSSDNVFDGTKKPHLENEDFSPINNYGASKAAGDIVVSQVPRYCILRASWVIGDGRNFVKEILELGRQGVAPTVIHDQIGRLTFTSELVNAIDHLLKNNSAYGTYNVTNDGDECSLADVARTVFHEANFSGYITNTTTAEYYAGKSGVAPRPLNSVFDLNKLKATGFKSHNWHDDLKEYVKRQLAAPTG